MDVDSDVVLRLEDAGALRQRQLSGVTPLEILDQNQAEVVVLVVKHHLKLGGDHGAFHFHLEPVLGLHPFKLCMCLRAC